jgi:GNAT superfamily N-acetyltransferase
VSLRIRNNLERADWAFIRELCAETGNAGEPIDRSRFPFFSELWVGPYQRLRPDSAYIVEQGGERVGYLTGCPDSARFKTERRWLFDLPLFVQARLGAYPVNGDVGRFLTRTRAGFVGPASDLGPEDSFSRVATRRVLIEYPAHLHMNLTRSARGSGVGHALVDRYREDLAAAGIPGVHLYCGEGPRLFYQRVGFSILDQIEYRPGLTVYRLGSRTSSG